MDDDIQAPGANPENLVALVGAAYDGKVVVPEFQRDFVWPRESVEELLTSLLNRYFIGTLLTLDTPAHAPLFPYRTLEGVRELRGPLPPPAGTVRLVLDGQQRLTSLFYALHEPPIGLKWTNHPYRFFVRLEPAIEGELDDAVVGISTGWARGIEKMEQDVDAFRALPVSVLAKSRDFYRWLNVQDAWDEEKSERLEILHGRLADFMIPVVSLLGTTDAENIVNIFERVNRTGVSLSLFDLVAARVYLQGVRDPTLHEMWKRFASANPALTEQIGSDSMLRLAALLEGLELKKSNLLRLDSLGREGFLSRWDQAAKCMVEAWDRLQVEYGAVDKRLIPYGTMLIPLAALIDHLRSNRLPAEAFRRLNLWYWQSVFSQRYDSGANTKMALDVRDVSEWCDGGPAPSWMGELKGDDVDLTVSAPRSAIYRGVLCLEALRGARDFCSGEQIALNDCQDDHIFPKAVYANKYPVNGVLNRAFIRAECNNHKRAKKPADFFAHCLEGHGGDESLLRTTLGTHLINNHGYRALLGNDFPGFVDARQQAIVDTIRECIGSDH